MTPWLPLRADYLSDNIDAQKTAEESHLKVYQALVQLRESQTIAEGEVNVSAFGTVFAFNRSVLENILRLRSLLSDAIVRWFKTEMLLRRICEKII